MGSGSTEGQQAMTAERLAEIRRVTEPPQSQAWRERLELLAEVERLRAENDELRVIASSLPVRFAAFQERHGERSGGDGQQR